MLIQAGQATAMANKTQNKPTPKPQFRYCPQCGRKGLYHVQNLYYRCRYCGIYIVSPPDQTDSSNLDNPHPTDALSKTSV